MLKVKINFVPCLTKCLSMSSNELSACRDCDIAQSHTSIIP